MRAGKVWILAPVLPSGTLHTAELPWVGPAFPPGAQSLLQALTQHFCYNPQRRAHPMLRTQWGFSSFSGFPEQDDFGWCYHLPQESHSSLGFLWCFGQLLRFLCAHRVVPLPDLLNTMAHPTRPGADTGRGHSPFQLQGWR